MAKCLLCDSAKQNDVDYGKFLTKNEISVHEFCLYLSSGLVQKGKDNEGIYGFLGHHIREESQRTQKMFCCFCHKRYANIGCCKARCRRSFHFICGLENGAVNQFIGSFRSFCNRHQPNKRKESLPADELCCICYEKIRNPKGRFCRTKSIKAPCCHNGWFHKTCLQGFANSAGYFFKCPLCNDTAKFRERIPYIGIFIRDRDAAWELEPNAFAELMQRPSKCEAEKCRHRRGRKHIDDHRDPLICCETCGAVAAHKLCLPNETQHFNCAECLRIAELRPSAFLSEGDSGRESMQAGDDDNEEVDVCCISDSDNEKDDLAKVNINLEVDTDNDEIKPFSVKSKVNRFSESSNEDEISVKSVHLCESNDDSESSLFENLSRKRKINVFIYSSDSEDDADLAKVNIRIQEEDSDDYEIKPFSTKSKRQRVSESSNDQEILVKSISNDENISLSWNLFQKHKIIDDSHGLNKRCSPPNENYDAESDDDDADPLDFLEKVVERKRANSKLLPTEQHKPFNKTLFNSSSQPSVSVSKINEVCHETKEKSTHGRMASPTKSIALSNDLMPGITLLQTENTANKENTHNSLDSDYCSSVESGRDIKLLDISCVANRTRRRKSLKSQSKIETPERQANENSKQDANTRNAEKNGYSGSGTNSECYISPLDLSCIAKRTRRRKSIYYPENNLAIIGEESNSKLSETNQTSVSNTISFRHDFNNVNQIRDDRFSTSFSPKDNPSSFSKVSSTQRNSVKRLRNQRLRLISLTTDEEVDESDAMKNR